MLNVAAPARMTTDRRRVMVTGWAAATPHSGVFSTEAIASSAFSASSADTAIRRPFVTAVGTST